MLPKLFFGLVVTLAAVLVFLLGLTILVGLLAPFFNTVRSLITFAAFARAGPRPLLRFLALRARSAFSLPCFRWPRDLRRLSSHRVRPEMRWSCAPAPPRK